MDSKGKEEAMSASRTKTCKVAPEDLIMEMVQSTTGSKKLVFTQIPDSFIFSPLFTSTYDGAKPPYLILISEILSAPSKDPSNTACSKNPSTIISFTSFDFAKAETWRWPQE